jgi:autophagy-related protein 13
VDDDLGDLPFHRSISLGADDREPPSLSDLRGFGQVSGNAPDERERVLRPAAEIESPVAGRPESVDREEPQAPRTSVGMHRPKLGGLGRGAATGSSGSLTAERGTGSGSERGQGRYSWARQQGQVQATAPGVDEGDDEYPLLFDMSELGRNGEQSRRSLEEGRGGGESGLNSRKGCSRRGW